MAQNFDSTFISINLSHIKLIRTSTLNPGGGGGGNLPLQSSQSSSVRPLKVLETSVKVLKNSYAFTLSNIFRNVNKKQLIFKSFQKLQRLNCQNRT